jgi:hypothetical protein
MGDPVGLQSEVNRGKTLSNCIFDPTVAVISVAFSCGVIYQTEVFLHVVLQLAMAEVKVEPGSDSESESMSVTSDVESSITIPLMKCEAEVRLILRVP